MKQNEKLADHKICFIICSNNVCFLEECLFYISRLEVPVGYEVETISIAEAKSMTGGYNEGMNASNAKYKIYLHQDVFIVYKRFLQSVLDIFHSDPTIGMIGMVGAPKMAANGIMWHGYRKGALYGVTSNKEQYDSYTYQLTDGLHEVEAIDGLMMITCMDILWREDIFDGWDFYDVSQSFEFQRRGYKVVVPEQNCAWCKHDDGILNLRNYDKYRKICIEEYKEYFYPERFAVKKVKKNISEFKKDICIAIIVGNQFEQLSNTLKSIKLFSDVDSSQIVIVDNGSQDGLHHWLKQQKEYSYMICGEMIEGYGSILNEVIKQFIQEENLLIMTPDFMMLPKSIENLYGIMKTDIRIGAVYGKTLSKDFKKFSEAVEYVNVRNKKIEKEKSLEIPYQGILINNKMLKQVKGFDEQIFLPQNTMNDLCFRGILEKYEFYEITNTCFYEIDNNKNYYLQKVDESIDNLYIEKKWKKASLNIKPNNMLLSCIKKPSEEEFSVFDIGCGYGANLLEIKRRYPMVKVYGIEKDSIAASIASSIAEVQKVDIEEKTVDFRNEKFDYIIFGNILGQLKYPEEVIRYCRDLLKKDGRIVVNVPNIMNYSVLRQLVNGSFVYEGNGFYDKTHLHFFTYKELTDLFAKAGYWIEEVFHIRQQPPIEEDREFVNKMVSLSNNTPEFMFWALEYYVIAKIL